MKVNELQGASVVKKVARSVQGKELPDVSHELRELGWNRIGAGSFARVFEHPKYPLVLKIFTSKDKCYIKFLKYIQQNSTNPYLPKIRGKILKLNRDFYAVRLEKLEPVDKRVWDNQYDPMFYDFAELNFNYEKIKARYPKYKELWKTMVDIKKDTNCNLDIHSGNFMMRGNQIVLIDPVW
jgi:hypothetical protein